jgi:multidrug efflux system membrane fusion protein
MTARGRWVAGGIALLVVGFVIWRIHGSTGTGAAAGKRHGRYDTSTPQAVGVAPVKNDEVRILYQALGTVTPLATVTVRTQINGQLMQIGFREGQIVKRGDLLALVDPRPYEITLAQAQGQLVHDQALLKDARIDLARYEKLLAEDSIASQQVDTQRYLVQQDEGSVQTDQAQIRSAQLNLTYCHITAPVNGRVGLRQVDLGNYIQVSDANGVVILTQLEPISAIFTLPEDDLPAVMEQVQGGAKLPVAAYDRANQNLLATGTLDTIDNEVDTSTGTVKYRALFENPADHLFPSQFVNIQLQVNVLHNAIVVPPAAVQNGATGPFVYVVNSNSTVSVRAVKPGPLDGQKQAILSGLTPGEQVVIDGTDRLKDGMAVTLPGRSPPAPGGSAGAAKAGHHHRHHPQSD